MNQYIFPFEKLDVYQMAVDLAEKVLAFLDELPLLSNSGPLSFDKNCLPPTFFVSYILPLT
jgi:hypothetical protein